MVYLARCSDTTLCSCWQSMTERRVWVTITVKWMQLGIYQRLRRKYSGGSIMFTLSEPEKKKKKMGLGEDRRHRFSGMTDAEDYLLGGSDTHTPLMTTIREAMSAVT